MKPNADWSKRKLLGAGGAALLLAGLLCLLYVLPAMAAESPGLASPAMNAAAAGSGMPWWGWLLLLFVVSFAIGVVAVPAGIGGGVLFVPILCGFFPFHVDFVRGAGLAVALSTALSAGPKFLRGGAGSLRLAMPVALVASVFAIAGALIGLALPQQVIQIALGVVILGAVGVMLAAGRRDEASTTDTPDQLGRALDISGAYYDGADGRNVSWRPRRTALGMAAFSFVGLIAGMFGMGAGWANVPVLNLVMGVPFRVAVATSVFLLSIVDTAALWIYFNEEPCCP